MSGIDEKLMLALNSIVTANERLTAILEVLLAQQPGGDGENVTVVFPTPVMLVQDKNGAYTPNVIGILKWQVIGTGAVPNITINKVAEVTAAPYNNGVALVATALYEFAMQINAGDTVTFGNLVVVRVWVEPQAFQL